MKRTTWGMISLTLVSLMAACTTSSTTATGERAGRRGGATIEARAITIYRSPTCSCCKEYEKYLAAAGYQVEIVEISDVTTKKVELGIPESVWSCHSSKLGDYIVEGHVPTTVLDRLLAEKPALKGIALPGMPAGAPGMGTARQGPLHIMSFDDGGIVAHFAAV
ncbi:MAG TPA: DUF411 domain-containing protein [Actinomycetota bacterium]|nr:DUF411 domain-containing protein [Actinomycetota bacterium]